MEKEATLMPPQLYTVEQKIKHIVESMNEDVEYLFMNWAQANVKLDRVTRPSIVYVLPPSGNLSFSWKDVKDSPNSQIGFLCNTDFDFEGRENDGIIEAMKRLCVRFIKQLNDSGLFEPIDGSVLYRVMYDYLDANVTGIIIEPTLKEIEGVSLCCEPFKRSEDVYPAPEDDVEPDQEEDGGEESPKDDE